MIFGMKKSPSRYLSTDRHHVNVQKQLEDAPRVLEELSKHGVSSESSYRLEFYFYTNSPDHSNALSNELKDMGYRSQSGPSSYDKRLFVIIGWSSPIPLDTPEVLKWVEEMCELGYEHDCEFDGWGTLVDQSQIPPADPGQSAGEA